MVYYKHNGDDEPYEQNLDFKFYSANIRSDVKLIFPLPNLLSTARKCPHTDTDLHNNTLQ